MNDAKFYHIVYVIEFTISQFQPGSQPPRKKSKINQHNKITKNNQFTFTENLKNGSVT